MRWILSVENDLRRRLPLAEGEQVVGSSADADLLIDHPTVSRRHAVLRPDGDAVALRDLDSSNGSSLDGQPVRGEVRAADGGRIFFGSVACRLETVQPRDLEPAIELPKEVAEDVAEADAPGDVAPAGRTLSTGSLRDFVASALPAVVTRLDAALEAADDEAARLDLVQAAGRALFTSFPCRSVEIVELGADGAEGEPVLFRADADHPNADADGPPGSGGDQDSVEVAAGVLRTRVRFAADLHAQALAPLVALTTRLAALGRPRRAAARDAPGHDEEPPRPELPDPAPVDAAMVRLYDEAARVARGDVSVLIQGETGTGKELLARYVHRASPRASRPWVALNCAALPQDLLESELFGIEKGVATGVEPRPGKFEQAHGGTLFLDEIGDMALATQVKILRVLQDGEVYRLGGREPRPARVRILAATHQDLPAMIDDGRFRLDLYHRIADCRFTVPPLRARRADLPNLAAHFLVQAARSAGLRARGISQAALDALLAYSWPGNVRQLQREMARGVLYLDDGELLQTRHLHPEVAGEEVRGTPRATADPGASLKEQLEVHERRILRDALARHDGNVRAAAKALGIGRTTLYRRLSDLGLGP